MAGSDWEDDGRGPQEPLLITAVRRFDTERLRGLGSGGVNNKHDNGDTALHWAARLDQTEACEILLGYGADVDARNDYGQTPLHLAAWECSPNTCRVLVEHGADLDARTDLGDTPLHLAASFGAPPTCEWLARHGANVNAKDNGGRTPLHRAAMGSNIEACMLLVACGADSSAKDGGGATPASLAGSFEIREFFQDRAMVYVLSCRGKGQNDEIIRNALESAGWSAAQIDALWERLP